MTHYNQYNFVIAYLSILVPLFQYFFHFLGVHFGFFQLNETSSMNETNEKIPKVHQRSPVSILLCAACEAVFGTLTNFDNSIIRTNCPNDNERQCRIAPTRANAIDIIHQH